METLIALVTQGFACNFDYLKVLLVEHVYQQLGLFLCEMTQKQSQYLGH